MKWLWNEISRMYSKYKRKQLPKLHQGRRKIVERYPDYEVGVGTYGVPHVHDWSEGSTLRIGAYCSISSDVHILLGGHHRTDWVSTFPFPVFVEEALGAGAHGGTHGNVVIGSDVWLAYGCTILSGVTIGHGAVVGARSVVPRDVPPYAIVAGNPAKIIGWRFDQQQREFFLQCQWWTWSEAEIRKISRLLSSDRLDEFVEYTKHRN